MAGPVAPDVVQVLVAQHERFLRFLEPRAGGRAAAEELLQAAFIKALERKDELRERESAVARFYRFLRTVIPRRLARLHGRGRRRP